MSFSEKYINFVHKNAALWYSKNNNNFLASLCNALLKDTGEWKPVRTLCDTHLKESQNAQIAQSVRNAKHASVMQTTFFMAKHLSLFQTVRS